MSCTTSRHTGWDLFHPAPHCQSLSQLSWTPLAVSEKPQAPPVWNLSHSERGVQDWRHKSPSAAPASRCDFTGSLGRGAWAQTLDSRVKAHDLSELLLWGLFLRADRMQVSQEPGARTLHSTWMWARLSQHSDLQAPGHGLGKIHTPRQTHVFLTA